jgi:hypothetical protein
MTILSMFIREKGSTFVIDGVLSTASAINVAGQQTRHNSRMETMRGMMG